MPGTRVRTLLLSQVGGLVLPQGLWPGCHLVFSLVYNKKISACHSHVGTSNKQRLELTTLSWRKNAFQVMNTERSHCLTQSPG